MGLKLGIILHFLAVKIVAGVIFCSHKLIDEIQVYGNVVLTIYSP